MMPPLLLMHDGLTRPVDDFMLAWDIETTGLRENNSPHCVQLAAET